MLLSHRKVLQCHGIKLSIHRYVVHASRDSYWGDAIVVLPLHYVQKDRAKAVVDNEIYDGIHARVEVTDRDRPVEEA